MWIYLKDKSWFHFINICRNVYLHTWEVFTQDLDGRVPLCVSNLLIALFQCVSLMMTKKRVSLFITTPCSKVQHTGLFISCVQTLSPCQGKLPRRKYMNMCPRASRSSRRLCSKPPPKKQHNKINITIMTNYYNKDRLLTAGQLSNSSICPQNKLWHLLSPLIKGL